MKTARKSMKRLRTILETSAVTRRFFGPALFGGVVLDGFGVAETGGCEAGDIHTLSDEPGYYCLGAFLRKSLVRALYSDVTGSRRQTTGPAGLDELVVGTDQSARSCPVHYG